MLSNELSSDPGSGVRRESSNWGKATVSRPKRNCVPHSVGAAGEDGRRTGLPGKLFSLLQICFFCTKPALQSLRIAHFWEDLQRKAMSGGRRKGLCPQITQMDADEVFWNRSERSKQGKTAVLSACSCSDDFSVSASNYVNLRAIRNLVAAGRAGPFEPFRGKSAQVPFHEQLTTEIVCS